MFGKILIISLIITAISFGVLSYMDSTPKDKRTSTQQKIYNISFGITLIAFLASGVFGYLYNTERTLKQLNKLIDKMD